MNPANPAPIEPPGAAAAKPFTTYASERDAVARLLETHRADLDRLLVPIVEQQVARPLVTHVLERAARRLNALRGRIADAVSGAGLDRDSNALLERAAHALADTDEFSFEEADAALAGAAARCAASGAAPDTVANRHADRAELAVARQKHRDAAESYADAAAVPELDDGLKWRFEQQRAAVLADLGRDLGDTAALDEAVALYRDTVLPLAGQDETATTWHALGRALASLGQRQQGTRGLEESVRAFEHALGAQSREDDPKAWARVRNDLGMSMGLLAQRHADIEMLERAIAVFESALEVLDATGTPEDWAATQNNLAAALQGIGLRNNDVKLLRRSTEAYRQVLEVWTRERAPHDWASAMNNLGSVLRMLGERRKGPRTLEQAVAAYRSALAVRTRDRTPQAWAMTQNNLGAALHKLGERLDDPTTLKNAVDAYENALKEWTRERMPMTWAMTRANSGVARRELAARTGDIGVARLAVEDLEAAERTFRDLSHAQYAELSSEQLVKARSLAAEMGDERNRRYFEARPTP